MSMRDGVRRFLGLDEIPTRKLLASLEQAQRDRHAEVMRYLVDSVTASRNRSVDRHGEIIELLTKLEQRFTSQHVGTRPANVAVYDWEQVQIHELAEMLANPPKDEN